MSLSPVASTPGVWSEIGTSTINGAVTVTRAAETNNHHYLAMVIASFDVPPTQGRMLEIKEGSTVIASLFVAEPPVVVLPIPRRIALSTAVSATLGAGGLGVLGKLTLMGYTIPG